MEADRYRVGQGLYSYTVDILERRPINHPLRPAGDTAQVISGSCQVELNRLDSSITFRYGDFFGGVRDIPVPFTNNRSPAVSPER
jgi:hypothetical protein